MKKRVLHKIDKINSDLRKLNKYIYDNPELGLEEYRSSKAHIGFLESYGYKVVDNFMGVGTAYKAAYKSGKEGPTIGLFAEYDALPEIGHGCGHNLLGVTSVGAAIVLKDLLEEVGGNLILYGTPAEENNGTKVDLARAGELDELDIAMLAHPGSQYTKSGRSLALKPIEFTFKGKTAHASSSPHLGINALDACISTFNNINALREHILSSSKIHGIIKKGGEAANIIPDHVVAQFYIRGENQAYVDEVTERVINCARAGSLSSGAELKIREYEKAYKDMITNEKLSEIFTKNLKDIGVEEIMEPEGFMGSIDMGDVSYVCPAIHPYFKICEDDTPLHTEEFRDRTIRDYAYENMNKAIYALVMTGLNIIEDRELLESIKNEFHRSF